MRATDTEIPNSNLAKSFPPTTSNCLEPSQELLDRLRRQAYSPTEESVEEFRAVIPIYNNCTFDLVRLPIEHTLEDFARIHFRPKDSSYELWRYSPEPLRRPLLKQAEGLAEEAVESYLGIMAFMGDLPAIIPPQHLIEFTDQIFRAPLKYVSHFRGYFWKNMR